MSLLSNNLKKRLAELNLNVPQVHKSLELLGIKVSYSAVAAWCNGGRRPREMEHLKALCTVLQTTISEMAGEDPEFARDSFESLLLIESRELDKAQREAVLAIVKSMKPK